MCCHVGSHITHEPSEVLLLYPAMCIGQCTTDKIPRQPILYITDNYYTCMQWYNYNMAKPDIMVRAQALRREGHSIHEISKLLHQPKSTVSFWCRDIRLSKRHIVAIQQRHRSTSVARLLLSAEKKRTARLVSERNATSVGRADVGALSKRDLFMLGVGLYWGEGYKRGSKELGFTNSDPNMIRAFMCWMQDVYGTSAHDFICRVSINNTHAQRVSRVVEYWVEQTGIPKTQFTKTSLIRAVTQKKYTEPEKHFGTLRIKVRRGAHLRVRILGSISHIADTVVRRTARSI